MTRLRIGGVLNAEAYAVLADMHRPDSTGVRAEAMRLLASGLQPRDVASALRVGLAVVIQWNQEKDPSAAATAVGSNQRGQAADDQILHPADRS